MAYYYYDEDGKVIGVQDIFEDAGMSSLNSRYFYFTNGVIWCERVSGGYDDPGAQLVSRVIFQVDGEDNILSSGMDADFDGTPENKNTFTYADGDVISVTMADGSVASFDYSTVIDTENFLLYNTIGKQVATFQNALQMDGSQIQYVRNGFINKHILQSGINSGEYVVHPNGFVQSPHLNKRSVRDDFSLFR